LAERAGLTAKGVGALETGKRRRPYPHTVRALAEALSLSEAERLDLAGAARGRGEAAAASPAPGGTPALPVLPAPLVGREREVAAVVHLLLRAEPRLLTLTGPGGVGKTGLAIAAATAAADAFPAGIAFVPLAPLSDPGLVVPTTLAMLGVRESGDRPPQERLRAHLRDKRILLILDNFEHLPAAAPAVAELLASCTGPKFLVTSRAPLRVRGEQEYPVPPLELPDLERVPDVEEVARASAVQLFVRRAREVSPAFVLTQGNATAVAAVCRRLDGLPLAIELAAAWIKLLPPTALLARLDWTLPILTGGPRDLPARQQTMRDAIAWSHDLLSPLEQVLFRRLAVFVGGFDFGGAEAVAVVPVDPGLSVLVGVASLVDKSLLRRQGAALDDEATEPRFGMLETVREFALERLVASGEEAAVRDAHAAWCLALVAEGDRELWGPRHGQWSDRLAAEYDNVRAVLAWTLERGQIAVGLRLTRALWKFIRSRGHPSEARRWQRALLGAGADLPPRVRIDALWLAGDLAGLAGDYGEATSLLEQCLALARETGDRPAIAKALYLLGNVAEDLDDVDLEVALYEEALALFRAARDPWWVPYTISSLGRAARKRGDYRRARALHEEALALQRQRGNAWGIALELSSLGEVAADEGDIGKAAALFGESIRLHADLGDLSAVYYCLFGLGKLAAADGRAEAAARLLGAAAALRDTRGIALQQDHRGPHDRTVARAQNALGDERFLAAWATGWAWSIGEAVSEAEAVVAAMTMER
jgi:predicted ATPase